MPIEFEYTNDEEEIENKEIAEGIDESENSKNEFQETEEVEEIEEIEFGMTEDEIDEWISELTRLKYEKETINLQIDDELFLKINPVEESDEEEDEN